MSNINVSRCRRTLLAMIAMAPLLAACAGPVPSVPYFTAEVPEDIRSAPRDAYPNINLAPDRPGRTKSQREVQRLERDLEDLRDTHIGEIEDEIERSGR